MVNLTADPTIFEKVLCNMSLFAIVNVKGKGLGMVARKKLTPGTLIIQESPTITLYLDEAGDLRGNLHSSTGEFECEQLDTKVNQLPPEKKLQFLSLADSFSKHKSKKSNFGIIKTNSFSVGKASETKLVLFPIIARINHSCLPNCHHYWSNNKNSFLVRAAQEIQPGEEICISYMSPLQRLDFHEKTSRQAILSAEFGFHCLCRLCSSKDHLENDRKRKRILEIEDQWIELGATPQLAIQLAEEQFQLCEELQFQAGLLAYVCLHCVEATSLKTAESSARGTSDPDNRKKCEKYAGRAKLFGQAAYGRESDEYAVFEKIEQVTGTSSDEDLVMDIRNAITILRDIDS